MFTPNLEFIERERRKNLEREARQERLLRQSMRPASHKPETWQKRILSRLWALL